MLLSFLACHLPLCATAAGTHQIQSQQRRLGGTGLPTAKYGYVWAVCLALPCNLAKRGRWDSNPQPPACSIPNHARTGISEAGALSIAPRPHAATDRRDPGCIILLPIVPENWQGLGQIANSAKSPVFGLETAPIMLRDASGAALEPGKAPVALSPHAPTGSSTQPLPSSFCCSCLCSSRIFTRAACPAWRAPTAAACCSPVVLTAC